MKFPFFLLLGFLTISQFACLKESLKCKDIKQIEGTYSGPYTYFSNGFEPTYDADGNLIDENYFEIDESGTSSITITILSEKTCMISFSGANILSQVFEGFDVLEYEWEDDLIYNNTLNVSGDSRNFSLRFEPDYQSFEFDWEKLLSSNTSTTTIHFDGSK